MHYYQFNIADYRKQTNYLSLLEHAIYRSLIDTYYLEERPLCDDVAKLMRTHNIKSDEEKAAFNLVINDFFVLESDGYHLSRCDKDLEKIYEKSEKARASAKARWDKEEKKNMRTHSEGNANVMLPNTHNPIPIKKDTPKPSVPPCPHLEIINLYHEILPELQGVIASRWKGSARANNLQSRWREDERHQDLEFWKAYFLGIRKSDWHMGREGNWKADLGWLVNRTNFDKRVEEIFA